jgi:hypothetical protein
MQARCNGAANQDGSNSMSRSITDIINAWYASTDEVNRMARDMNTAGVFYNPNPQQAIDSVLEFMDKPWHWDREHAWWVANEWPDDYDSWERGRDTDWEVN